jgi:hypothetical protein
MLRELARLCKPLRALIESAWIAKEPHLHRQVIEFLNADAADHLGPLQCGLLRAAHGRHRADALRTLDLSPVHAHCSHDLTTRLNTAARAKDDWSITTSVRCPCKLCATLTRYLRASDKVRFEWPLARTQRAHIHNLVDFHDLPVRHTTRRTGRPYTLVLEKTIAVFERDAAERRSWQKELQWLTEMAADF